jgi:hypothetical protein
MALSELLSSAVRLLNNFKEMKEVLLVERSKWIDYYYYYYYYLHMNSHLTIHCGTDETSGQFNEGTHSTWKYKEH